MHCNLSHGAVQQEHALYLSEMALTPELKDHRDETFHAGVSFLAQGGRSLLDGWVMVCSWSQAVASTRTAYCIC
jgi:hypothetical protein